MGLFLIPRSVSAGTFKPGGSLSIRESYDDNVFLQDETPLAKRGSWVTTIAPAFSLAWTAADSSAKASTTLPATPSPLNLKFTYSPEFNLYHQEASEDNTRHLLGLNLNGTIGRLTYQTTNQVTITQGNKNSPVFTGEGGGPAIGGFQVRERRKATVYRDSLSITYTKDPWFIRPTLYAFAQDFQSVHKTLPGYANYVDRNDVNGGFDIGYKAFAQVYVVAGYRYGQEAQGTLPNDHREYSNDYHRVLFGLEGKPAKWLKVAILIGPDFRHFGPNVATDFFRYHEDVYTDSTITVSPDKDNDLTFFARRFLQMGSGGHNAFDDSVYSLNWKHTFNSHWSTVAGFKAYQGDCLPLARNDWIFTPCASISWKIDSHLTTDLSWQFDRAQSQYPNTSGREYHRNLISAGVKYEW